MSAYSFSSTQQKMFNLMAIRGLWRFHILRRLKHACLKATSVPPPHKQKKLILIFQKISWWWWQFRLLPHGRQWNFYLSFFMIFKGWESFNSLLNEIPPFSPSISVMDTPRFCLNVMRQFNIYQLYNVLWYSQ